MKYVVIGAGGTGGAIGGYLLYRKKKGGSVASMKGKVKDTL